MEIKRYWIIRIARIERQRLRNAFPKEQSYRYIRKGKQTIKRTSDPTDWTTIQ